MNQKATFAGERPASYGQGRSTWSIVAWCWGGCCWNLEEIVQINCRDYDDIVQIYSQTEDEEDRTYFLDFFEHRRFWLEIGNGDALMMDNNHATDGQELSYFMHDGGPDDGFGAVLGQNFEDFIDRWTQLAFVGPEFWILGNFLGTNGVDPDAELGKNFRSWFFAEWPNNLAPVLPFKHITQSNEQTGMQDILQYWRLSNKRPSLSDCGTVFCVIIGK